MSDRSDAVCAAAEFVLEARDAARALDGAVATVGWLAVEPGAVNVIPGRVSLSVDARAPDADAFAALLDAIRQAAERRGGAVELSTSPPVPMAAGPRHVLREELEALGVPAVEVPSGAGHDAGVLAAAGVPTAMLFVRSRAGGVSHSPEEHTDAEDVALCVAALERALRRLATA